MTLHPDPGSFNNASLRRSAHQTGSRSLAITVTVFGAAIIITEMIGVLVGLNYFDTMSASGAGIICAIVFVITGTLGILATSASPKISDLHRKRLTGAFTGMSVISCLLAIGMSCFSAATLGTGSYGRNYERSSGYTIANGHTTRDEPFWNRFFGFRSTDLILFVVEFVLFIVAAAFGCCLSCGCCRRCCHSCCCEGCCCHNAPVDAIVYRPSSRQQPPSYPAGISFVNENSLPIEKPPS
ncbi:hypothetical protein BV898_18806 [Hypsibius exemplaris]|uniref:Uncharacterized protein n=1 Tax=Hypsibius exemplaris TaxID=2072580 RepID=A0A9X6NHY9_HYPEX|nr:hypothetical protein BV898_18806 [Hypsibius exemplaris]